MDSSLVSFCRRMKSVAKLLRFFMELFVLLAFLSWLATRLPFAVRTSGEYCRRFSALILSPASIFLLGNAIVLTLLAKSGLFSSKSSLSSIDIAVAELYDELRPESAAECIYPAMEQGIVFQDKEIICEENAKMAPNRNANDEYTEDKTVAFPEVKANYRRSKSEDLRRGNTEAETKKKNNNNQKLRRSETDICRKELAGGDEDLSEDDMSNEEFQRTIEAFIAKQVTFHREERLAVVLHGQA